MRDTALEVTESTERLTVVELRPCWAARLFGARKVVVGLRWMEAETTPIAVDHHHDRVGRLVCHRDAGWPTSSTPR